MRYPFASITLRDVAADIGARVELEPEFQFVGEIIFKNGQRHLFRNTNFNLNPAGAVEIAKDKGYTNYFMRRAGFRVPMGRTFFSDRLNTALDPDKRRGVEAAVAYARNTLGYPVIVKPNNLSQGKLVCKVCDDAELRDVAAQIFALTNVLLVEELVMGRDYRMVVLGDEVISAYERRPLEVIGDGVSTVAQLLMNKQAALATQGRPNSEINLDDFRIDATLKQMALTRDAVPAAAQVLLLLSNANLSTGGDAVDVTHSLHDSYRAYAIAATRALGLTLCGVDVMCADATKPMGEDCCLIELNGARGLDNYASIGAEQNERVRHLYRSVLRHLEHKYIEDRITVPHFGADQRSA